jgi:hypothetical protein
MRERPFCPAVFFTGDHELVPPQMPTRMTFRELDGKHLYNDFDCPCRHCDYIETQRHQV